jgi:hypothetical protein
MEAGEHFFTLCEFCLVCQAISGLSFGYGDRVSQKIVEMTQTRIAPTWQI